MSTQTLQPLPHEKLIAYERACQLIGLAKRIEISRGNYQLVDQLDRASASVSLNIAEGCGRTGKDRRRFYITARASALESGAALQILEIRNAITTEDYQKGRAICGELYAILTGLIRATDSTFPKSDPPASRA